MLHIKGTDMLFWTNFEAQNLKKTQWFWATFLLIKHKISTKTFTEGILEMLKMFKKWKLSAGVLRWAGKKTIFGQ